MGILRLVITFNVIVFFFYLNLFTLSYNGCTTRNATYIHMRLESIRELCLVFLIAVHGCTDYIVFLHFRWSVC